MSKGKRKDTAPAPEVQEAPETAAALQEPEDPDPIPTPDPEPAEGTEQQDAAQDSVPAGGGRPLPYRAAVAVSLAVLHKAIGVGTADMLRAVGTLRQGVEVTVTGRSGPFAQLKNGLWVKESFLEA